MKKYTAEIIDEIQLNNLLMKGILDSSPSGIMVLRSVRDERNNITDFEWILINTAAEKILNIKRDEMIGKNLFNEIDGFRKGDLKEKLISIVVTGESNDIEHVIDTGNKRLSILMSAAKYKDGLLITFSDNSRNRDAEEERNLAIEMLIKNEEKLRRIIENINDSLIVDDIEGNIIFANKQFLELFGFRREDQHKLKIEDYIAPEFMAEIRMRHDRRIKGEIVPDQYEFEGIKGDGERIYLEVKVVPVKNDNGQIIGTQSAIRDITQRKRSELKVQYLNRVYAVLSNINQAIVRINDVQMLLDEACRIAIDDGKFRLAWIGFIDKSSGKIRIVSQHGHNMGFIEKLNTPTNAFMTGIGPAGIAIRSRKSFVCNDIEHHEVMSFTREEALKRGFRSNIALPLIVSGEVIGSISLFSGDVDFFNDEEIKLLEELSQDISYAIESIQNLQKKMLAESRLKESELRFRTAFDTSPIGMTITGIDGKLLEVNNAFCELLGYSKEELLYMSFISLTHPDDRDKNVVWFDKLIKGDTKIMSLEKRYLHKDGTTIWVSVSTSLVHSSSNLPLYFITCIQDISKSKN